MIEYKYKKRENKFTENGHTMFEADVLQRLKRLADLEEQIKQKKILPIQRVSNSVCYAFDWCKIKTKKGNCRKNCKHYAVKQTDY